MKPEDLFTQFVPSGEDGIEVLGYRRTRDGHFDGPQGLGAHRIMFFHTEVEFKNHHGNKLYAPSHLVIIRDSDGCRYGRQDQQLWTHSWIRFQWQGFEKYVTRLGLHSNQPYPLSDADMPEHWLRCIQRELYIRPTQQDEQWKSIVALWLTELSRQIATPAIPSHYREIAQYLEEHLGETLMLSHLSKISGQSPEHTCTSFKKYFGASPMQWLKSKRLTLAQELLSQGSMSIAEIGARCGYSDPFHFSKAFKAFWGQSPRLWLKGKPFSRQSATPY